MAAVPGGRNVVFVIYELHFKLSQLLTRLKILYPFFFFFAVSARRVGILKNHGYPRIQSMIQKIKEIIFKMDLKTQMDEARQYTEFALTHEGISKKDKE